MLRARTFTPVFAVMGLAACADLIGADFDSARRVEEGEGGAGAAGRGASGESADGGTTLQDGGRGGSAGAASAGADAGRSPQSDAGKPSQNEAGRPSQGDAGAAGDDTRPMAGDGGVGGASAEPTSEGGAGQVGSAGEAASGQAGAAGASASSAGGGGLPSASDTEAGGAHHGGAPAEGGASGAGGEGACGTPTAALDPDGDGLNDACDLDDDEDSRLDDADAGPRDPLWPPPNSNWNWSWPGVLLADGCVERALGEAGAALLEAELATAFPLHLAHTPAELGPYFVRPNAGAEQGYFVGGPDATPGALLRGAEIKLQRHAAERTLFAFHEFDDAGVAATSWFRELQLRGSSRAVTLFYGSRPNVLIISGSVAGADLRNVAMLTINVGYQSFPSATCPVGSGRWALSWSPRWRRADLEELNHLCIDEGKAYAGADTWTRTLVDETCECDVDWAETPAVVSSVCTPNLVN